MSDEVVPKSDAGDEPDVLERRLLQATDARLTGPTMAVDRTHARPPAREILVLADGVELIGEYEDSGFKEPPLLARRADGQMIQLTRLLYLVAEAADGRRDEEAGGRRGLRALRTAA